MSFQRISRHAGPSIMNTRPMAASGNGGMASRWHVGRVQFAVREHRRYPSHSTKTVFARAAIILFLKWLCTAQAGTLFTNPVIVVTPMALDFGAVATHRTATNTFLVENAGGGKLVGHATVAPPFKVVEGGDYTLRENEAQVVTIIYTPRSALTNIQTATFTGGGGAKATVVGRLSAAASPKTIKRN
jgi:hypothetical protein